MNEGRLIVNNPYKKLQEQKRNEEREKVTSQCRVLYLAGKRVDALRKYQQEIGGSMEDAQRALKR
jgi:hypothetical protein